MVAADVLQDSLFIPTCLSRCERVRCPTSTDTRLPAGAQHTTQGSGQPGLVPDLEAAGPASVGRPPGLPTKRSRKARRVLYPARVRKYLPRPKKDVAKRWLLVCAGIVLLQVLTEEPEQEGLAGGKVPKEQLCTLHAQLRRAFLTHASTVSTFIMGLLGM
uniref:Radiation-inducible immediate-early gene IEX-1 n=1 Tax=Meleagris gallopavo TaxID=9103 RepID=A0A803XQA3_MELGA